MEVKDAGIFTDLDAPLEKINVHVRGGFIIPMQTPGANLILGRANPFTLLVAQSATGNATGNLFWDDGDSIGTYIYIYVVRRLITHIFCVLLRFNRNKNIQLLGIFTCSSE